MYIEDYIKYSISRRIVYIRKIFRHQSNNNMMFGFCDV